MSSDPALDLEAKAQVESLRRSFLAGRISKEGYERSLRALGVDPEAVNPPAPSTSASASVGAAGAVLAPRVRNPPPPEPSSAPPRLPEDLEARAEQVTKLFREGKMGRGSLEANLARIYEAIDPRLVQLRLSYEGGRIPKDVYDANVHRLLRAWGAP